MRQFLQLHFDSYDPDWPVRIHEAFDRLAEFAPELHAAPRPRNSPVPFSEHPAYRNIDIRASYARIVTGEEHFGLSDLAQITEYGFLVAKRAREKAMSPEGLPYQGTGPVLRAAEGLVETCKQLRQYVDQICLKKP